MKSVRTNERARCPVCQKRLDTASGMMEKIMAPKAGDVSVCAYCTTPCIFNADLSLRLLRVGEFEALDPDVQRQIRSFQLAAAIVSRKRNEGTP